MKASYLTRENRIGQWGVQIKKRNNVPILAKERGKEAYYRIKEKETGKGRVSDKERQMQRVRPSDHCGPTVRKGQAGGGR